MIVTKVMKDALQQDEETDFSLNSTSNKWERDGVVAEKAGTQRPEEVLTTSNPVISHQFRIEEGNIPSNPDSQPKGDVPTVITPIPEVVSQYESSQQQSDRPLDIKAATRSLNKKINFIAAVEKDQENTLKYNDQFQIQRIQNDLQFIQPAPIADTVYINTEAPIDVFPRIYRDLMNSISLFLKVPVSALIPALLGAVYIAARGKFKIKVLSGYFEIFTEYIIAVMPSGFNKSGIVQTFRNILEKYFEKLQVEFDKQAPSQKMAMKLLKQVEKKLLKTCANQAEGKDGAEIDLMLKDIEATMAPLKKVIKEGTSRPNPFNDVSTTKKLAENMLAQNEFGAIYEPEGAIFKIRVTPKDDGIFLKGYNSEYFGNETATNGSVVMQNPCLAICSYIQPGVAAELYSKGGLKEDGLLARFLVFFCLSKPSIPSTLSHEIDPELMAMYEHKISSILEYCWEERRGGRNREIEILHMTDGAQQEYLNFSHKVNIQTHEGKFRDCEAFAAKLAGHAIRLAGAIHFLEHDKPWEKPIGSSAMRAGIALAEFYAEHAIYAFDTKVNDSVVYARKILKWIKNNNRFYPFDPREAQNGISHGAKNYQIEAGIDLLIKNKYLAMYQNYKGKMVYIVNPNIFTEKN